MEVSGQLTIQNFLSAC